MATEFYSLYSSTLYISLIWLDASLDLLTHKGPHNLKLDSLYVGRSADQDYFVDLLWLHARII